MKFLKKVIEEHEGIERELIELGTIIEDWEEITDYSNLVHVIKNLYSLWNCHEKREEGAFDIFKKEKIKVPIETMLFEHSSLKKHKEILEKTLSSKNAFQIKKVVEKDLKKIMELIREHIKNEELILYSLPLEDIFTEEEKEEIDRRFG
jgi:hemerythrin-like domain-containing protein